MVTPRRRRAYRNFGAERLLAEKDLLSERIRHTIRGLHAGGIVAVITAYFSTGGGTILKVQSSNCAATASRQ